MRIADPHTTTVAPSRDRIIFAHVTSPGTRRTQEDAYAQFGDECLALADGVGGMPHGDVASTLAVETAVWAYRHIRQRPFYWEDKKRFMKRIFRTANMTVWQKHRERGFEDGLATTLLVAMFGPKSYWVGTAGDTAAFLCHGGHATRLTRPNRDEFGSLTRALGINRLGLVPEYAHGTFAAGDTIICATDGVADWIHEDDLALLIDRTGDGEEDLRAASEKLLASATTAGSTDNQTVAIVKRVAVS